MLAERFALPSGGWKVRTSSSPSRIRIALDLTRAFTVAAAPDSFLQLSQWQYLSVAGFSSSSNLTPRRGNSRAARPCLTLADVRLRGRLVNGPADYHQAWRRTAN